MTIELDTRLVAFVVWGLGTVAIWAAVLRRSYARWRRYRDRRAWHDALSDFALFLVAAMSALGITMAIFGIEGRGVISIMALGMFTMAGVVKLMENGAEAPE